MSAEICSFSESFLSIKVIVTYVQIDHNKTSTIFIHPMCVGSCLTFSLVVTETLQLNGSHIDVDE